MKIIKKIKMNTQLIIIVACILVVGCLVVWLKNQFFVKFVSAFIIHCPDAPIERQQNILFQIEKLPFSIHIINCVTPTNENENITTNMMTPLETACYKSHMKAFKTIRHQQNLHKSYSFIFEDDFMIEPDFATQIEMYLYNIAFDFDLIMLSPYIDSKNSIPSRAEFMHLYKYNPPFYFVSTAGYVVNNKNIDKIIDALQINPAKTPAFDHALNQAAIDGKLIVYYIYPRLVNVQHFKSTLQNKDLWNGTHA